MNIQLEVSLLPPDEIHYPAVFCYWFSLPALDRNSRLSWLSKYSMFFIRNFSCFTPCRFVWAYLVPLVLYARAVCKFYATKLSLEQALLLLSIGLSACLLTDIDSFSACGVFLMVWGVWHSLNVNVLQHGVVWRKEN